MMMMIAVEVEAVVEIEEAEAAAAEEQRRTFIGTHRSPNGWCPELIFINIGLNNMIYFHKFHM